MFAPLTNQENFQDLRNLFSDHKRRELSTCDSKCLVLIGMRGKKWDGGEDDNEANLYDQGLHGEILAVKRYSKDQVKCTLLA